MRFFPAPKSININSLSAVAPSLRNSGVSVALASFTFAKAEMTRETGATTSFFSAPSFHTVFIDRESLPTGIEIPSAGQSSMPTASAVANNLASSPG